jgi:GNAT superfamily N-acetyltransferase
MEISPCVTDEDYEAWRTVRMTVVPGERCDTVAELRAQDSPTRLLLLARADGTVVGSGMADRSETTGGAFATARVLPDHRRRGVGSAILRALADHCAGLGLPELRASVDDEGSLAFAHALDHSGVTITFPQVSGVKRRSWPVGRVLSPHDLATGRGATIHLRPPLPTASCGLPAYSGGPPSDARCLTLLRAGFA